MPKPSPSYRNILIIKPGAIGDLLHVSPVIRALHRAWPDARISMIVGTEATASLFEHDPRVTAILRYDRSWSTIASLCRSLRRAKFDLVLNFQRSNLRTWVLIAATLPCRVLVYHKERTRTVHAVRNYLDTLAPVGIHADDFGLELFLDEPSRAYARSLMADHGLHAAPVIALNAGATGAVKQWPVGKFAELCDLIAARTTARALLVGGPEDLPLVREILARSASKPASIAGATSLLQLGAVLERCAALVTGDTGPMHVATAVGTKVIALFGSTDPARTGPVGTGHQVIQAPGVSCVPCRSKSCANTAYLECMEQITAETVLQAIERILPDR